MNMTMGEFVEGLFSRQDSVNEGKKYSIRNKQHTLNSTMFRILEQEQ